MIIKKPYVNVRPRSPYQATLKVLKQTGRTNVPIDRGRNALLPGKRVSARGNIYWETRKNRSDSAGSRV